MKQTLDESHPDLVKEWHPTKNGDLKPSDFLRGSGKKVWWLCDKVCPSGCKHEWQTSILKRSTRGDNCIWCSRRKICEHITIRYTHPDIFKELHPSKNKDINKDTLLHTSEEKVWWLCDKKCDKKCDSECLHEWETSPRARIIQKSNCPYCCNQKICKHTSLEYKYPDIARELHTLRNEGITADKINPSSDKKYWWVCDKSCPKGCKHEWEARVVKRCSGGCGCPLCSKKGPNNKFCEHVSIVYTHPIIASEWHPSKNGIKKPSEYVSGSHERAWWLCKNNHDWDVKIKSRCSFNTGCPYCKNKTEKNLFEYLKTKYTKIIPQLKLDSCKNKRHLPFDFCIPELKTIIELDGRQHFKQVSNWASPEESIKRDVFKMQKAIKEGYKIIRIFQEDVYNNDNNFLEEHLYPHIISKSRDPVYITSVNSMYDIHIELLKKQEEIILELSD